MEVRGQKREEGERPKSDPLGRWGREKTEKWRQGTCGSAVFNHQKRDSAGR